jgi:cyclophilin family peptidyl-prolyl cis-trans isomerase
MSCITANAENEKETLVLIETSMGDITIKLYDETPLHRDNFIKLVKTEFFDRLQFHRVIKGFMIQGGDPESKNASEDARLGSGGPGYTIPAEFVYPKYFHKRGALSAARQSDQVNPKKESSGSQFYIVWGTVQSDAQLDKISQTVENNEKQRIFNQLVYKRQDTIRSLQQKQDTAGLQSLQDELISLTESQFSEHPVRLTSEQREAYRSIGGTPFLDNEYTVFGEVVEGLDVVEQIQAVETNPGDRPKTPVIMKMKIKEN